MKTKLAILSTILICLISYIAWIFYMSEPKYVDNPDQQDYPNKYDIVSMITYNNEVELAMVIQVDSNSFQNHYATVKSITNRWDKFYRIQTGTVTPQFHIVGRGTFYHKVNHFVGFNIMFITTICIMIIAAVIFTVCIGIVRDLLGFDPIFD